MGWSSIPLVGTPRQAQPPTPIAIFAPKFYLRLVWRLRPALLSSLTQPQSFPPGVCSGQFSVHGQDVESSDDSADPVRLHREASRSLHRQHQGRIRKHRASGGHCVQFLRCLHPARPWGCFRTAIHCRGEGGSTLLEPLPEIGCPKLGKEGGGEKWEEGNGGVNSLPGRSAL